jgi:glycosyltransferase involved in cell wall biosynthesis
MEPSMMRTLLFGDVGVSEYIDLGNNFNSSMEFDIGSNALIVNHANPNAIAKAILNLVEDEELYARIQANALASVKNRFQIQRQLINYQYLYRKLTNSLYITAPGYQTLA